jgi:hypothetical protein
MQWEVLTCPFTGTVSSIGYICTCNIPVCFMELTFSTIGGVMEVESIQDTPRIEEFSSHRVIPYA